ncbi:hypothetical protein CMO89_04540 [Candidatus Woesearchaeota archaeon]|nr:hypothetical protein [Candidatus Woesearchaeota archaeon]
MNKLTIFLITLFILGCQTQQSNIITYTDVHKGTDGLVMKFLPNAPPEEVYSKGIFVAAVELDNKGAFNIVGGHLALVIEEDYMEIPDSAWDGASLTGGTGESKTFSLEGKSTLNPKGRKDTITAKIKAKEIDTQSESHTSTVMISACYKYKTDLSTEVCVDTDPYSLTQKTKACEIGEERFSGQGAPVAITKVETKMLPHEEAGINKVRPAFMVYIENKGNGEVVKNNKVGEACSSVKLEHEAFNTIYVRAFLSGKELNCSPKERLEGGGVSPEGYVRLKGKEDFVRCSLEEGIGKEMGTYTAPLTVELDYGYTFSISKDVEILKELEY